MKNNYIETEFSIAFIYNGMTYEKGHLPWYSVVTVVDPAVDAIIQKRGTCRDEVELAVMAAVIIEQLLNKLDSHGK